MVFKGIHKSIGFGILLGIAVTGVVAPASASFVQDATDAGAADTLAIEFGTVPDATTGQFTARVDLYCFSDANHTDGVCLGFAWDNTNAVLDSAVIAPDVAESFDLFQMTYMWDSLPASNRYQVFCFTGYGSYRPNLEPSAMRRHWASYYFTLQEWSSDDSLVIDTSSFIRSTYVRFYEGRTARVPFYTGPAVAYDASACCDCPARGNLDGSADCVVSLGDLTVLIDHLMGSLAPLNCDVAGNLDLSADGLVTMGDLTVMIDHLFITLTPLPTCP